MTICIGLCVYKNEFGLPYVFKNIEIIQTLFQEKIQIIVAYDESPDCSLGFLISKLSEFDIHVLKNVNRMSNSRVENIVNARNKILEHIRKNFTETKYLIMMDSNEYACVGDISLDILKEVLKREKEWDAVSFDREAGYYDYGALYFDPLIYSFSHTINYQKTIEKILENAKQTPNEFISVFSAFNGFAIYKWSVFQDCKYSSTIDISLFLKGLSKISNFSGDCEHRHFHLQAIRDKNAKIQIYPKFLFSMFKGDKMKGCRGPC